MTQFKCAICGASRERYLMTDSSEYGLICAKCNHTATNVPSTPPSENTCVCCGEIIPEGRQVCAICETKNTGEAIAQGMVDGINYPCPYTVPPLNINKKKDIPVDIHKIIDDAMDKRDRTVSIYIGEAGVSVSVYPVDQDRVHWIYHEDYDRYNFECSNCGMDSEFQTTYCHSCGELMHGVRGVSDEQSSKNT